MKINVKQKRYEQVSALTRPEHRKPMRPHIFFRTLIRILAIPDLLSARFSYTTERMELVENTPCLILMNHSSFIDLKVAYKIFYPRPLCTVCTSDGFIGKYLLMRLIGCIPTNKFVSDVKLIGDMQYALKEKKANVLMYPEASYSFDGTATPLPRKLGVLLKKLKVPVVTVTTSGAFSREPLYNCLQKRSNVPVSAKVRCLLTAEEIAEKSVAELDAMLDEAFTFDGFAWQRDNNIIIDSPTRADGLNRILYRCTHCGTEGKMHSDGIHLWCEACGKKWEMTELGELKALEGETEFSHIPDWSKWERACVREEIRNGTYFFEDEVIVETLPNARKFYHQGKGKLTQTPEGTFLDCESVYGEPLHVEWKALNLDSMHVEFDYKKSRTAKGDCVDLSVPDDSYWCYTQKRDVIVKLAFATEEINFYAKEQAEAQKAAK